MRLARLAVALAMLAWSARADASTCAQAEKSGRAHEAIACYQALLEENHDPRFRADTLTRLAWLHFQLGEFERALAAFRETLAVSRELHDRTLEARTINFTGLLYQMVGDTAAALEHDQKALAIALEVGDPKLQGEVLYQLGWVHFARKDFRLAIRYYTESLTARREAGDRYGEAMTLLGLGMTHTSLNEFETALRYENEALPLAHAIGNRYAEADALDHIGTALTFLHRPLEAIDAHSRALQIRKESGHRREQTFSLSGLARAQHELGRVSDAAASMAEVIDILEGSRRSVVTRRFRGSVFAGMRGHYDRYVSYLMELRDSAAAFAVSERARGRLTLDSVQEALARADAAAGGTLIEREQALQNDIENSGSNIEELVVELSRVEDEIRTNYPRLAAARDEMPLDAQQIESELLDGDTALLEYSMWDEKSFAWLVTRSGVEGFELPPRQTIEPVAVRLHQMLSAGDQRANQHEIRTLIDRLSAMIVAPLKIPPTVSRLIIVPDGALFYIPFAALENHKRALIDDYEITAAPSASTLVFMRRAAELRSHDATVAVFADPVFRPDDERVRRRATRLAAPDPELVRSASESGLHELRRLLSTRAEAETITRLASGPSRKALDFEASRKTVISDDLGRYRIIHFATHALVNAQHPALSGIVLSLVDEHGSPVDGFLRVRDLFNLNIGSDLVVLSGCRTAMGKELRGEGIVGLVSGFMHAGAPRVVASYWDVKDQATSELMKRFYRKMFAENLSPAAALRAAQRSMRRQERWRSPYYWAAFSLFGLR